MKKYLCVYEAPCVGTCEELFEAESDFAAEMTAWERSCSCREYVDGGYDLYRIIWTGCTHKLVPVIPADTDDAQEGV